MLRTHTDAATRITRPTGMSASTLNRNGNSLPLEQRCIDARRWEPALRDGSFRVVPVCIRGARM